MDNFPTVFEQAYGRGTSIQAVIPDEWIGQRIHVIRRDDRVYQLHDYGYFKHRGYDDRGYVNVTPTGKPYGARVIDLYGMRPDGSLIWAWGKCPFGISIIQGIWLALALLAPFVTTFGGLVLFGGTGEDYVDPDYQEAILEGIAILFVVGCLFSLFCLAMVGLFFYYYREPERGAAIMVALTAALFVRAHYVRQDELETTREHFRYWDEKRRQEAFLDELKRTMGPDPSKHIIVPHPDYTGQPYTSQWAWYDELTPDQQRRCSVHV